MKSAAPHTREAARLNSLHACGLRDDVVLDAQLTAIARRAARHFSVPIALVSIVQEDRQVFAGRVGLQAAHTSRDVAFCAHVVVEETPLIVEDTQDDERFADNPLVLGAPNIRFYAGVPVYTPDGLPAGTVCLIDKEPRRFAEADIEELRTFAKDAEVILSERYDPSR